MKRIVCLLLALLMLSALAACGGKVPEKESPAPAERHVSHRTEETPAEPVPSAEADGSPAPTERPRHEAVRIDPSEVPDGVHRLLDGFGWLARSDAQSFTGSPEDAVRLMRCGFELIVDYDGYPGPKAERTEADPKGRWASCLVYDAEKLERILRVVYSFDGAAIAAIRDAGEDEYAGFYCLDGRWYVSPQSFPDGASLSFPLYAESDGVNLYLYYAVYNRDRFYYPGVPQYAVVSEEELDGERCWTLRYWSKTLPVIGLPDLSDRPLAALGDYILEDDGLSSLRVGSFADGTYRVYVGFFRLLGLDAEAQLIKGGELAILRATDGTGFQGLMEFGEDAVTLRLYDSPNLMGYEGLDEKFNGRAYRFVRGSVFAVSPDDEFSIAPDELAHEIEFIRGVYYTPSAEDSRLVLSNGTDGWNYSREYYYHNGLLVFAFIYNGTEEHRLYFKDGHMIRYIDEHHTVYDFGALDPFASWAERAWEEGMRVGGGSVSAEAVDPSDWLGTWYDEGGEWIMVTAADENGISFTYHHSTELGTADTSYSLPFLNAARTFVAEDESLIVYGGWRYCFYLEGDHIRVTSRYPDRLFYK